MATNPIPHVKIIKPAGATVDLTRRKTDQSNRILVTGNAHTVFEIVDEVVVAPAPPAPAPEPPAPPPPPAPAPEPSPASPPVIVTPDSPIATVYNRTQGTSFTRNWNACMEAANHGDVIEVSPGAIHSSEAETRNYFSNNLSASLLAVYKAVTIRNVPGAGRWKLYPDDTWIPTDKGGICIYAPWAIGGLRGAFTIEGFEFDNHGFGAGVRIMNGPSVAGTFDGMNAAVALRNFKFGKRAQPYSGSGRPPDFSESGLSGSAQTLVIENGHVFDCGGLSAGQDHNAYLSAETMTIRGLRSVRSRGILDSAGNPTVMDGHQLKLSAVNGLIEGRCVLDGYTGDMTHHIQLKAGGNWIIRGNLFIDGVRNQSAGRGPINMCRELAADLVTPNYEPWAGRDGNSLLIEDNDFLSFYGRPCVYFFPAGHIFNRGLTMSAVTIRNNVGMVAPEPTVLAPFDASKWIANDPTNGPAWPVSNTALPFDATEAQLMATAVNYSYRFGRGQPTNVPAWRLAMTNTDTVYEIGGLPSAASVSWPSGSPPALYSGTDSNYLYKHYGYGGNVFASDLGVHGTPIFGGTGEGVLDEQLTQFPLSDDSPAWSMFQQPSYVTTLAAAVSAGADGYLSAADAAAINSAHDLSNAGTWTAAGWDGAFPCKIGDWVIRRKETTSMLGNNRPHSFRFEHPAYVPAALTGTGHGAIVVSNLGFHGPYGNGNPPAGIVTAGRLADWYDSSRLWGSGRIKQHVYAMDVVTKAWTVVAAHPDVASPYTGNVGMPVSFLDEASKKLYYYAEGASGTAALHYLDLASGLAAATFSADTTLTTTNNPSLSQSGNHVYVPGQKLLFAKSHHATTPHLLVLDVQAATLRALAVSGLPSQDGAYQWGFSYDAVTNRVYITVKTQASITKYQFTVPADPSSAGNYTVTSTVLTLAAGVSIEDDAGLWQYGNRNHFHDLGVVMLTQHFGKMLGYRPAP